MTMASSIASWFQVQSPSFSLCIHSEHTTRSVQLQLDDTPLPHTLRSTCDIVWCTKRSSSDSLTRESRLLDPPYYVVLVL